MGTPVEDVVRTLAAGVAMARVTRDGNLIFVTMEVDGHRSTMSLLPEAAAKLARSLERHAADARVYECGGG